MVTLSPVLTIVMGEVCVNFLSEKWRTVSWLGQPTYSLHALSNSKFYFNHSIMLTTSIIFPRLSLSSGFLIVSLTLSFLRPSESLGQAPSTILPDLSYFKITYPVDANGNDYTGVSWNNRSNPEIEAYEIPNDDPNVNSLTGYVPSGVYANYFYVSGNEVVFKAHCAGALTSVNSYPRCELRERILKSGEDGSSPSDYDGYWDVQDEQELNATFRIMHLPDLKEEVCVLQIKGRTSSTSGETFRLDYRADNSQLLHIVRNENTTLSDVMDYTVGDVIQARLYVNNGSITVELDNLNVSGSRGEYSLSYSSDYDEGYFKAGCYTQSSIWEEKSGSGNGESPTAYAEVRFSELTMGAANPPANCVAAVPANRSVSTSGTSATFSWDAVPNTDHYKVRYRPVGGTWVTSGSIRNTTSYSVSGLSSGSTYEWQVRMKCLDNTVASSYSAGQGPDFTVGGSGGGLPSPWSNTDVGGVATAGSASYSSGTFTLEGSGADIWNSADEFHFVYQQISGDVSITARVTSVENTNAWAKAGVMVRESLTGGSKHAMNIVTPARGVSFQRRTSTNGGSAHTTTSGLSAPYWVRMVRSGNTFTSYRSTNGSSWTNQGSVTISMNSSVYVGLVTTSHNDGTLCTASLDNVSVSTQSTSNCSQGTNLAENAVIASYSDQENSSNGVANVNDGTDGNRWSANGFPQDVVIDLGDVYSVNEINLMPYQDRAYQFTVEGSSSSASSGFSTLVDASGNTSGGSVINRSFSSQAVRYVKLTITGASGYSGSWSSVEEFEVLCAGSSNRLAAPSTPSLQFVSFPNPFHEYLHVSVPEESPEGTQLQLSNLMGQTLWEKKSIQAGSNMKIQLALPKGIYLLNWRDAQGQMLQSQKVIRQ